MRPHVPRACIRRLALCIKRDFAVCRTSLGLFPPSHREDTGRANAAIEVAPRWFSAADRSVTDRRRQHLVVHSDSMYQCDRQGDPCWTGPNHYTGSDPTPPRLLQNCGHSLG